MYNKLQILCCGSHRIEGMFGFLLLSLCYKNIIGDLFFFLYHFLMAPMRLASWLG